MNGLDSWLAQATRHLAQQSAAQVRSEIQEHYTASCEAAVANGASAGEAGRAALSALGDAKIANRQYRRVLLTSAEARMLRDGNREARAVCNLAWMKRVLPAVPMAVLAMAAALFLTGRVSAARDALIVAVGIAPAFLGPVLPIYTPSRSLVFRVVKWAGITGAVMQIYGPEAVGWSWLPLSCLWTIVWIERTRASIRRKLPVSAWPRQLYL